MSIPCCWHSLVWCDTASLRHFFQISATWKRRCILADGLFLFHHCLLLLVIILLKLIQLTSNSFYLSYSHPLTIDLKENFQIKLLIQICTINVHSTRCYLSNYLYKLTHTNLFNHWLLYELVPINWYHHCLLYKLVPHIQICPIIGDYTKWYQSIDIIIAYYELVFINWYHRSFYKLVHIYWDGIMNYYDTTN